MNTVFQNKASGFRATLGCIVLSIVTVAAYATIYSGTRFISWAGFAIMLIGILAAAVLVLQKMHRFAPAVLLVGNFLGLLFHVHSIYFYISSVVAGIQFAGFPLDFYVNFILMGLSVALSVACIFMPVDEK